MFLQEEYPLETLKRTLNTYYRKDAVRLPAEGLVLLIKFYKNFISPLFPPSCRFYPTCSSYSIEALHSHGLIKGTALSVWRVLRCNPFSKGGYDPVPKSNGSQNIEGM